MTAESREMEELTYAIALDLRTPLRTIESVTGMLLKNTDDSLDQKNRTYLQSASDATHQMSRLIDDLFTFARIGRTDMHRLHLSLAEIVQEVIHDHRHETEGREIEWKVGSLPEVIGDPVMLWIVMTNLISNAIKFTRPRETAVIEIGALEQPGEVVIFVRDNGVGFDMHYAPRLFRVFQRFHKDEFAGTGVGLANVRRIVQRHGGRTWAEGVEDQGAVFYLSLPCDAAPL
jgi:light-regulated signal transduction histidine kinase (bacteriophytochrome)